MSRGGALIQPGSGTPAAVFVGWISPRSGRIHRAVRLRSAMRFRRFGLLMDAAETWLRERELPKIQFMVRGTNTAVLAFYDHLGYEPQDVVVLGRRLDG